MPPLVNIAFLFAASFLVTSVFSVSLKAFFAAQSWSEVLGKGLLIPCFTWTVLLIASLFYLRGARRLIYWTQLGIVCLIGSFALIPAALYNFIAARPAPAISIINVLSSVILMFLTLYFRLQARQFDKFWAFGWMGVIVINMLLYIYSIS